MPPYTNLSFEEIEAKEWASNTVETILKDITPVSFQSVEFCRQTEKPQELQTVINEEYPKKNEYNNPVRRSFSFLESNLFFTPNDERVRQKNTRRSQSTMLPSTSSNIQETCNEPTNYSTSFSSRICDAWHNTDRASNIKTELFNSHKKSSKELKTIHVWKTTLDQYMAQTPPSLDIESKPYTKRSIQLSKFIMTELLTTEETYLNHLMTIKRFYMDPLLEIAQKKSSLVNIKDIEIIFAFIPQLIILSSLLVERLRETLTLFENESTEAHIGRAFCDLEPLFDIYIAYTINFSKSKKHLSKASSSIVYRQLVQHTIRRKETNKMVLSDYMIAPIQRITRYCLLLKDLIKYSKPSNSDYVYLNKTLKSLSALAYAMNTVQ